MTSAKTTKKSTLPILPLRDIVVFPNMVVPLFIGREKSISAIETAFLGNKKVFLVAQKDSTKTSVEGKDIHHFGTVGQILQLIRLADGTIKALIEGICRGKTLKIQDDSSMFAASISITKDEYTDEKEIEALRLSLLSNFDQFVKTSKKVTFEVFNSIASIEDASKVADNIAAYLPLKLSEKQQLLETVNVKERMEKLMLLMEEKTELIQVEKKIKTRVKKQVEKSQREYYLNEQLKAIYKELGDPEDSNAEIKYLELKIKKSKMSEEAKTKALGELKKLRSMPPTSQEGSIIKNYIDWILSVPWTPSDDDCDITESEKALDEAHYGLEKIKERILEYLAVHKRMKKMKGQILCFVGPPGVGKTSLGKAIATATKKSFARIALGGINDEAEIRGHRRTYIGAMPGKIMQAMKKAQTTNPIIMLDEIDKLSSDWRGDPASALLEVLDPEQNSSFVDHYMEVPYDLSDVMFITTANSYDIPPALLDRMEIIKLSGYTEEEKLHIAKEHIIPKQFEQNGLKQSELKISDGALLHIIRNYTKEAGVRNLEREISKIARKSVRKLSTNKDLTSINVDVSNLSDFLGIEKFEYGKIDTCDSIGVVNGMAWTELGGDLLIVEALLLSGSGKIISTGKLGEVMQESIKAAYSYVKSKGTELNIDPEKFEKRDIHVHVPEGAVPKDGPSAGCTICTAIVSAMTNRPVRKDLAMTGEITLHGKILPIGGLKEKLLAAVRGGIKCVFIPKENEKDLTEMPSILKEQLLIKPVSHISEILSEAFV